MNLMRIKVLVLFLTIACMCHAADNKSVSIDDSTNVKPIVLQETDNGFYFLMGFTSHTPFKEHIHGGGGIHAGGGAFFKRHMVGIDIDFDMGCGTDGEDFDINRGTITKYSSIIPFGINMNYGYTALRTRHLNITPFLGTGLRTYKFECGYKDEEDNFHRYNINTKGLSLGVGCAFNIIFSRHVLRDDRKMTNGISVKPYFSMTHHDGGLGWVRALNVAVDWNLNVFKMK